MKNTAKGIRYYLRSFGHSFDGLRTLLRSERNMTIHMLATVIVIALGWWRGFSTVKWALCFFAIGFVWVSEAMNTALERLCDAVSEEYHPLIRQAKDISAAAVLIAAVIALATGILLFFC